MFNYDNLPPGARSDWERLMSQPMNQWPPELIQWVQSQSGPLNGEAIAEAVAGWLMSLDGAV